MYQKLGQLLRAALRFDPKNLELLCSAKEKNRPHSGVKVIKPQRCILIEVLISLRFFHLLGIMLPFRPLMDFLIIDSSAEKGFVALVNNKKIESSWLPLKGHAEALLPAIENLLTSNHLSLDVLDFLAIGTGPGSFTGTRLGVLTAKMLSFAKKLPLIPFCSSLCFTPSNTQNYFFLMDAKSQGIYCFDGHQGKCLPHKNLAFPKMTPLFSLDPQMMKKKYMLKTSLAEVNFPFLIDYLIQKYYDNPSLSLGSIKVSYFYQLSD